MPSELPGFVITAGSGERLDRIEPMWVALRDFHADLTDVWRDGILANQFALRRDGLIAKTAGGAALLVLIATSTATGDDVGYCIASLEADGRGFIHSLYVADAARRRGIGRALMNQSLEWLCNRGADPIGVDVLAANDAALRLYESAGFRTRTVALRLVQPTGNPIGSPG